MTPKYTFESVYPRAPFAPLVDIGLALTRIYLRLRQGAGSREDRGDSMAPRAAH